MNSYETRIEKFLNETEILASKYFGKASVIPLKRSINFIKIRVAIKENLFFDIYYNSFRERKDFALIHKNNRIYGYDNLPRWHFHPLNDTKTHSACKEPSLEKVFKEIKTITETFS